LHFPFVFIIFLSGPYPSQVTLRLPLNKRKREELEPKKELITACPPVDYSQLGKILVVDDNRLNRKTLMIYLTKKVGRRQKGSRTGGQGGQGRRRGGPRVTAEGRSGSAIQIPSSPATTF
jgi:hypothetical protein